MIFRHEPPRASAQQKLLLRAGALLGLLLVVKLFLLATLRDDLVQTHYRFYEDANSPGATLGFYLLGLQLLLSLGFLAARCDALPVGSIRRLNGLLLLVGLAFVVLSRAKLDTSYVYSSFAGWTTWGESLRQLSQDSFSRPPLLIAYVIAHLAGYGLLLAKRREAWSPYLIGGIAVTFGLLNLRGLQESAGELVLVNVFGAVSLWSAWRSCGRPLAAGWHFALLGLFLGGWWVFRSEVKADEPAASFLLCQLAVVTSGYLAVWLTLRRSPANGVVSHFLPFYAVGFILLSTQSYPLAVNHAHALVCSVASLRYGVGEAGAVAAVLLLAWLVQRGAPRRGRLALGIFDSGAVVLLLLAVLDLQVTRRLGTRLDWHVLAMSDDAVLLWRAIHPYVWGLLLGAATVVAIYFLTLAAVGARLRDRWAGRGQPPQQSSLRYLVGVACLVTICAPLLVSTDKAVAVPAANVLATSPLARAFDFRRMSADEFFRESKELGIADYLKPGPPAGAHEPEPLNVLLVILESTFNQHLSLFGGREETQPLLKQYQDRMELFPNFYAPFPNSLHARFSILNGLYPGVDYPSYVNPHIPAPSLFEILKPHGYANSLFYSSHRDYTRFADYLRNRRLDVFHDSNDMPGREKFKTVSWGIEEACTKAAIEAQFTRHAEQREKFFLTYIPAAPHQPFEVPDRRFDVFDTSAAYTRGDFTGAYLNSLRYLDWVMAGLLDKLSELRLLDHTLVVITGDHGELLGGAAGQLGHGWKMDPTLCNVPLIILDPRRPGYRVNLALGSQVDLLPTILAGLNLELPRGELYQGVSLLNADSGKGRRLYLDSYHERVMIDGLLFRQFEPGARGAFHAFEINHTGARSEFRPILASRKGADELARFERLQRSLLRHYEEYRAALAGRLQPVGRP